MSDLISSLIVPKTSQESFQSAHSQPPSPLVKPTRQNTELQIYDIDAYLNDEKNKVLLAINVKQNQNEGSSSEGKQRANNGSPPEPVQLGVRTSQHVTTLFHLCQERSIVPEFEIDGNQDGFGGVLRIGEQTVAGKQKWGSKKAAKEALAEKGVEVVKGIEAKRKSPPARGGASPENWIGKLLGNRPTSSLESRPNRKHPMLKPSSPEYQNAIDPTLGPAYVEYALGLSFACTVRIPSHSSTFGSSNTPFPNKKAARSNAAREAVQYLVSEGLTNPDGTPKAKNKKIKLGQAVRIEERGMEVRKGTSWAQRVDGEY